MKIMTAFKFKPINLTKKVYKAKTLFSAPANSLYA